jgi:peptidoglycan-associated lipoprotein
MLKKLFIIASLALAVSACSSGKKKGDGVSGTDAGISSEDLSFDPRGSDSGAIQGLETVNFGYDQATLSASAKQALQNNAEWLKENPGANMQLEGHCDIRGSIEYNLALGERRARAVKS